ncbi:MAG: hypothetical protein WDO24_03555 [Pseudomonadota bacterium]
MGVEPPGERRQGHDLAQRPLDRVGLAGTNGEAVELVEHQLGERGRPIGEGGDLLPAQGTEERIVGLRRFALGFGVEQQQDQGDEILDLGRDRGGFEPRIGLPLGQEPHDRRSRPLQRLACGHLELGRQCLVMILGLEDLEQPAQQLELADLAGQLPHVGRRRALERDRQGCTEVADRAHDRIGNVERELARDPAYAPAGASAAPAAPRPRPR